MAILKQIKFGESLNQIAMTKVAIDNESKSVLSVVPAHTRLDDANDPLYTIALAVDGKTILKGSTGLETALALQVKAAVDGDNPKKARIAMVDHDGAELSSVNIDDIVGNGVITETAYDPITGELTITWAGNSETVVNLGKLLDIDDVAIESDSQKYLKVALNPEAGETGSQAVFGAKIVKVAEATDATTGLVDAKDVKDYVDNAATGLAVSAQGDDYITAAVDGQNNKKINVTADVQKLTATAGTPGEYSAEGKQTTAPAHGSLSGVEKSLVDGANVAAKVKEYVDGEIAIEVARADAKVLAAIKALDFIDPAVEGQYVSAVSETDGVISVERVNVADAVLNGYAKGEKPASTVIAATDDVKGAIAKLEHQVDAAQAAATTKVVEGTDAGNNLSIDSKDETDGSKTYTINLTDVASKAALDDEIAARKAVDGQNGQTYVANAGTNYISAAASLNDADVKLDAELKKEVERATAAEDAIKAKVDKIKYNVDGTTLIVDGISKDESLKLPVQA